MESTDAGCAKILFSLTRAAAVTCGIMGTVDHAHTALADLLDDPVMAQAVSYHHHLARQASAIETTGGVA